MNPIFYGIVNNCEVIFYEKKKLRQFLIDFEGKEVEVVIRQPTSPRTLQQNKYLFGVCYKMIADETGHTPEEIHEVMKSMFLKDYADFNGQKVVIIKSTTSLNTKQFGEYVDKVKRFAAQELGIVIPDAEEVEF